MTYRLQLSSDTERVPRPREQTLDALVLIDKGWSLDKLGGTKAMGTAIRLVI